MMLAIASEERQHLEVLKAILLIQGCRGLKMLDKRSGIRRKLFKSSKIKEDSL